MFQKLSSFIISSGYLSFGRLDSGAKVTLGTKHYSIYYLSYSLCNKYCCQYHCILLCQDQKILF